MEKGYKKPVIIPLNIYDLLTLKKGCGDDMPYTDD